MPPTLTTRLGLSKPDPLDLYDITLFNNNSDKIDLAAGITICTSTTRPTTPYIGMAIFETDTLRGYVWDGDEWIQNSFLVVSGYIPSALLDAKGDLIVATAADVAGRLGVGSDNARLIAKASAGTGLQWHNNPPKRVVVLADVASVPIDPSAGQFFTLAATGNRTIQTPSVAEEGQEIVIAHTAAGGAARTVALTTGSAGSFKLGTGITISATASGLTDLIFATYVATPARWCVTQIIKAF